MGRPKEFPEKLYVGMDKDDELILLDLTEKTQKNIEQFRKLGCRVQLYCVPEPFKKPHKTRNQPQTPAAAAPKEPDNQLESKPEASTTAIKAVSLPPKRRCPALRIS